MTEGARGRQVAGIEIVVAPIAPCAVACSLGVLTSIIANLVRNAIKHMGDAQERAVAVRVEPSAASLASSA